MFTQSAEQHAHWPTATSNDRTYTACPVTAAVLFHRSMSDDMPQL